MILALLALLAVPDTLDPRLEGVWVNADSTIYAATDSTEETRVLHTRLTITDSTYAALSVQQFLEPGGYGYLDASEITYPVRPRGRAIDLLGLDVSVERRFAAEGDSLWALGSGGERVVGYVRMAPGDDLPSALVGSWTVEPSGLEAERVEIAPWGIEMDGRTQFTSAHGPFLLTENGPLATFEDGDAAGITWQNYRVARYRILGDGRFQITADGDALTFSRAAK